MTQDRTDIPLCVDLDGTLIRSDLLIEGAIRFLRRYPLRGWRLLFWLTKGRARLKGELARSVHPPLTPPPVNHEVLVWLGEEKSAGRKILLVTASHKEALSPVLDLFAFDEILASNDRLNLKDQAKAKLLVERFGERGFDYVGDSASDEAVWRHARKAIPVFRSRKRIGVAERKYECPRSFFIHPPSWHDWMKALRIHHWSKNLLIALPFIAGHHFQNASQLASIAIAFLSMSLCASGTYLWNDLLDLDHDRAHPLKKKRLAASGRASLQRIVITSFALVAVGLLGGLHLDPLFGILLLGYIGATLSYSLHFKRVPIADIFLLTFLYLSRVIGGIIVSDAKVSFWLFSFTFLLFISLAATKRFVELRLSSVKGDGGIESRGYIADDLPTISGLGMVSGVSSCIVLSLYSTSAQVTNLYLHPEWLWGICVISFYWITRIWFLTHRGLMHDDPVVFALKDRLSWILALTGLVCVFLADPISS